MKHILLIAFAICSIHLFAQPQAINYQGVARNSHGLPLVNRNISLRLSVLDSSGAGQSVYVETQNATTNGSGLFNIGIGLGTVVSGTFSSIPWGSGDKWLKTEMDTTGSNNFQLIGTTQFLSVPYALNAGNGIKPGIYTGDMLYWNGTSWLTIPVGSSGRVLTLNGNIPTWTAQNIDIGDFYQGGYVAYILRPGDPGYDPNIQHGLIAAPFDQSSISRWYNNGSYITTGATGEAIGTGNVNTIAIVNAQGPGSYAAKLCYDLVLNGYSDWYLPSHDELIILINNKGIIGSFTATIYWSSTEYTLIKAGTVGYTLQSNEVDKMYQNSVRAIRAF